MFVIHLEKHKIQKTITMALRNRPSMSILYLIFGVSIKKVISYLERTLASKSNPFRKQGLSKFSSSSIIRRWQEQCNLSMMQFCIQSCIELFWNSLLVNLFIFCLTPCTIFHQLFSWEFNQPCLKSFNEMNITKYNTYKHLW